MVLKRGLSFAPHILGDGSRYVFIFLVVENREIATLRVEIKQILCGFRPSLKFFSLHKKTWKNYNGELRHFELLYVRGIILVPI